MNSSSAIASSSSSSPLPPLPIISQQKYDVFISFRGPDTRQTFTSCLHAALCRKNICTFIDDELKRGDPILTLFPIIENSKISVLIFSPNYASSDWCLNELVKILDCRQTRGQVVLPVFYNADPSDVRNQTGSYAESFADHHRKQTPAETIKKWRNALREAAALSGWNTAVTRPDALLAEEIAKDVWKRLYHMSSSYDNGLVGIDSKVEKIESMLYFGPDDLCVVGIWGIGGIGKTTLAQATFDKLFSEFENAYFIRDVKENSKTRAGLSNMREKLFSSMLGGNGKATECISNFVLARLCRQKVIIVFDDVSDSMQVESITGPFQNWSNTGSRFIITSRNKQVLQNLCNHGKIYELKELLPDEALQLFCRDAFKQELPMIGHIKLSKKVVQYTKGVPLVLKVLGCSLYSKSKKTWESEILKLERILEMTTYNVLKISFDELEDGQKKIFLDVGLFFQRNSRDFLVEFFDACDFKTETELVVLVDKCLISFDSYNTVRMHDLLRGMCREIVRQESIDDPGKRSRLWNYKDIYQVFRRNTGTQSIEGISLDMSKIDEVNLQKNAFKKMRNLRLLKFYNSFCGQGVVNKVLVPQGLDFVLDELRYLWWDGYPMKSLQPYFALENLVHLDIQKSSINQLWGGVQRLLKLRNIVLFKCEELTTIPDLLGAESLKILSLHFCSSLRSLPSCAHLKFLSRLDIEGCPRLDAVPDLPHNLEELVLGRTGIEELPSSIGDLHKLKKMIIRDCSKLKGIPYSFHKLRSLNIIEINRCQKFDKLPHDLGDIEALRRLCITYTAVEVLPPSICKLISLQTLDVSNNRLARLPRNIGDLKSLVELKASYNPIEELPSSIVHLSSLRILALCGAKLKRLPSSIHELKSLKRLSLCGNKKLEDLTIWESLGDLKVNVSEISEPEGRRFGNLHRCFCGRGTSTKSPQYFSLTMEYEVLKTSNHGSPLWMYDTKHNCFPSSISKLKSLVDSDVSSTPSASLLGVSSTRSTDLLRVSLCSTDLLRFMDNLEVFQRPEALGTSVVATPSRVRKFSSLLLHNTLYLGLTNCGILEFGSKFGELSFLRELELTGNKFENLPASIINLSELQSLTLICCDRLKILPELPRNLKVLDAAGCSSLENLPSSSVPFLNFKCSDKRTILLGCHKLDRNLLRVVIEDGLLKNSQVIHSKFGLVIYPGFEIPEWFSSQSVGSLITLGCFNRKISGISFYVVVNLPCIYVVVRYKLEREYGQFKVGKIGLTDCLELPSLRNHDGYHVIIKNDYFGRSLCQLQSVTASFGFYVERRHNSSRKPVSCFDVKACGVRFLYDENLRKRHKNHSNNKE